MAIFYRSASVDARFAEATEMHGKLARRTSIKLHTINGGIRVVALRTTV
jgi:hypothetical protein